MINPREIFHVEGDVMLASVKGASMKLKHNNLTEHLNGKIKYNINTADTEKSGNGVPIV